MKNTLSCASVLIFLISLLFLSHCVRKITHNDSARGDKSLSLPVFSSSSPSSFLSGYPPQYFQDESQRGPAAVRAVAPSTSARTLAANHERLRAAEAVTCCVAVGSIVRPVSLRLRTRHAHWCDCPRCFSARLETRRVHAQCAASTRAASEARLRRAILARDLQRFIVHLSSRRRSQRITMVSVQGLDLVRDRVARLRLDSI